MIDRIEMILIIYINIMKENNLNALLKDFERLLKSRNQKVTSARLNVMRSCLELESHFTIEELLSRVAVHHPKIGTATVYRTIKIMKDYGLVEEFRTAAEVFYEFSARRHHDHLICLKCKTKIEFCFPPLENMKQQVARQNDFEMQSHRLIIYGICAECQKNKSRKGEK